MSTGNDISWWKVIGNLMLALIALAIVAEIEKAQTIKWAREAIEQDRAHQSEIR